MNESIFEEFIAEKPSVVKHPHTLKRWHPQMYTALLYIMKEVVEKYPNMSTNLILKEYLNGVRGISDMPDCAICGVNKVRIHKTGSQFSEACSEECANKLKFIKSQETVRKKYGNQHFNSHPEVIKKRRETCKVRYGAESHMKTEEYINSVTRKNFHSEEAKSKKEKTYLERYGGKNIGEIYHTVDDKRRSTNHQRYGGNPSTNEDVKEKRRNTMKDRFGAETFFTSEYGKNAKTQGMIDKFGVDNYFKHPCFQNELRKRNLDKLGMEHHLQNEKMVDTIMNERWTREFIDSHGMNIFALSDAASCDFTTAVRYLEKYGIREKGKKVPTYIEQFVYDILDKASIPFIANYRMSDGKHIDVFIPDRMVGFELHGNYWHSSLHKDRNYHRRKLETALKDGIDLFQFFEDEVVYKSSIVRDAILMKSGGSDKKPIYARKTRVVEVSSTEFGDFLDKTHIQGRCGATLKYGLVDDTGELVSVMGFNKGKRNTKDNEWDLVRFSTSSRVIGGFSKILKHFIKHQTPERIISYSDRRVSNGGLYEKCGFTKVHDTPVSYFYVDRKDMLNRQRKEKFRKSRLKKIFDNYDDSLTERENCEMNGFFQIFDAGLTKYALDLNNKT